MDDVGTAVGEINTRFDVTGESLENLTETFLKYARINGSDVNSSIDNVSAAMKAFSVNTEDTGYVLDALSAVGQKTGINMGTLESTLVSNSATFKEMDLSIYESAQLLGQFEKNGVDTSTAITGLKKAQQEATKEKKTLSEALDENISSIKNAKDKTEALQIATELFGKRGASAMAQAIREGRFELSSINENMTKFSGTVSNTFKTIQKEPDKLKITTNKLKIELASLAEKVIPKIEKGIEIFNDNLPDILETGKKLLPVVTGVGTAFAAWKISKSVTSILSGNPFSLFVAGAGLAVTAIDYFKDSLKKGKTETEKFIEEQEKYQHAARDSIEEIKNLKREADENAVKIDIEYDDIQKKWDELQTLVDQNGKIKEGYEARVQYITNELTNATGVEIELVDGQIQKYGELKNTIEETIEKQRAQRLFENYSEQETEYIQKRDEAKQEVYERGNEVDEAWANYKDAKSRVSLFKQRTRHRSRSMSGADRDNQRRSKDNSSYGKCKEYACIIRRKHPERVHK